MSTSIPTTFALNWGFCENGSGHPVACTGVTSWMGPPLSKEGGLDVSCDCEFGPVLVFVAERFRKIAAGWSVDIIPDDYEEDEDDHSADDGIDNLAQGRQKRQKREERSLKERELAFIRGDSWEGDAIEVFDENESLVASFTTMGYRNPWLLVGCLNDQVTDRVYQVLREHYDLGKFPHSQENVPIPDGVADFPGVYMLEAVTGSASEDEAKSSITTLFSLYYSAERGQSLEKELIAKALCSYQNGEMCSVGPTLEMIETAKEWKQRGFGSALMRAIHSFYCTKFESYNSRVLFSVCHVTNFYALKWFRQKHYFRILDGMGQELGKYLDANEYEEEDEGGDGDY
mmetsp:Transcript_35039/g.52940  ORF Transcript_35039/g.52940 Transcript_35039/m.52940 type:complete len:344 (+) Transcript_35039:77-1108(+)